jgi:hypothetical protein
MRQNGFIHRAEEQLSSMLDHQDAASYEQATNLTLGDRRLFNVAIQE